MPVDTLIPPGRQPERDAYDLACREVVDCIRDNLVLDENTIEALVENQQDATHQKQLVMGLKCVGLIGPDAAALEFYRRSLRGA